MGIAHRRVCAWALVVAISAFALLGWKWPAGAPRLIHTFAEVVEGEHLRGLRLTHPSTSAVHSAHNGRVLLRVTPNLSPLLPPHALGGFVLVAHPDGTRTLYSNIDTVFSTEREVKEGTPLGEGGVVSESTRGFEFRVMDSIEGGYINPLLVLPRDTDFLSPTVRDISITRTGHTVQGEQIVIEIEAYDRLTTRDPLLIMPYYWGIQYGATRYEFTLDAFRSTEGHLTLLSNGRGVRDAIPALWRARLGPLPYVEGQNRVSVSVGDHVGRYSIRRAVYSEQEPPEQE